MKILDMEQEGETWLQWRKSVIGGTDCPAILRVSPYATPLEIYQNKLSLFDQKRTNGAMINGKTKEPIARAWFNETYQSDMKPAIVESDEYNFLGASLDGISSDQKTMLEIKVNGKANHAYAQRGEVVNYHLYQIYHQLICTRAEKAFYLSYTEKEKIVIEIKLDAEFEETYIPVAKEFWRRVVYFDPPPYC